MARCCWFTTCWCCGCTLTAALLCWSSQSPPSHLARVPLPVIRSTNTVVATVRLVVIHCRRIHLVVQLPLQLCTTLDYLNHLHDISALTAAKFLFFILRYTASRN